MVNLCPILNDPPVPENDPVDEPPENDTVPIEDPLRAIVKLAALAVTVLEPATEPEKLLGIVNALTA